MPIVLVLLVVGVLIALAYRHGYLRRPLKGHTKRVVIMRSNQLYHNPADQLSNSESAAMLLIPEVRGTDQLTHHEIMIYW